MSTTATTTTRDGARREMAGFRGTIDRTQDAGYEEARKIYNAMIDKRPALIARCADADDVASGDRVRP